MAYRIRGLERDEFRPLFELDDDALAKRNARRVRADGPGYPCRVTLEEAREGESLILVNHASNDAQTPFRATHAIFVREAAGEPAMFEDRVPPVLQQRTLSLRGFDEEGMLRGALLAMPGEADARIRELFERPEIASVHAHNAALGCFPGAGGKELIMATAAKAEPAAIDGDWAWARVMERDRTADGRFVTGVLTTGIYCRPSCAARHPRRENVRFFASGAEAAEAGLRPCLRCKPDEVSRETAALERALRLVERAEEPVPLQELAAAAGYSPHHFHRLFKRAIGVTPAEYARGKRARNLAQTLERNERVTDAIYEAGYSGPGRFYADAKGRLGMTPTAWRGGGQGETIRWATAPTDLGSMLVAATDKGICRLSFDEDEGALRRRFPNATIEPGGEAMAELVRSAVEAVNAPEKPHELPLDVRGTAFQQAVWRELSRIPPGETLSYAALAARAGKPGAARAAGSACGANNVAVLIPCHRARRGDGSLGGFAYGLDRKVALLDREAGGEAG